MSHWKIFKEPADALYYLTLTIVDWNFVFTSLPYFECIVQSLQYCQKNKDLRLLAFVIMLNHVHLIAAGSHNHALSDILRDFKHFTAVAIINLLKWEGKTKLLAVFHRAAELDERGREHKVWMNDNHPILIESAEFFRQKLHYLHENPVRKGYVDNPEYWLFSSARNYSLGGNSVLEVELLEC